ncbi:hypothetical protein C8R44DRAFT_869350 [Mycena epipterygia]|nr:hypothetical protein C8R44DRAFT_869350 [Mycena epipterygia]
MDETSLNSHPSQIPSPAPVLSTLQLDALTWRTSLIHTTVNKYLKGFPSGTRTSIGKQVLIELIQNRKLWIFAEGDQDYCLTSDPILDSSAEEWKLSPQNVDTVKQMLEPDDVFLQLASQTTLAIRIGMIIWLVITSLTVQNCEPWKPGSAWDKWDLQGRAITIWADTYSEIMRSKKRPSEAIPTDIDAVAAFKCAMDIAGHHHDYQATPDLGAWVTMHAALFPELKGTELASWHFNDEDGCSLCDERFREKLQSETGLDYMPPLHLVALWEIFRECEDFEERIAFVAFHRPHLFSPEIVKPVQELLAQQWPKDRRKYALKYQLEENDSFTLMDGRPPSWKKVEDIIDSLRHLAPRHGGDRSFPPIEPIFWFGMVRVLGGQYQSQDKGKKSNWRPRVSLAAAHALDEEVLGEKFPPLNLELLPEYVQRAVKRFCRATEGDEHTCTDYDGYSWGELDVEVRTRYAAAYALLYSTDLVPLLGDDNDNCDACSEIRALYDCVDEISAGQITLGSKNIAKVLGYIKQLAVISDDCKFTFPEDRLDVDDSNNISETSQRPGDQQQRGSNSEILRDETHDATTVTENAMNHFKPTALTQLEAYDPGWQADFTTPQIYDNLTMGQGSLYTMTEAHASVQEHVGELTNLRRGAPRQDSEPLLFRDVIPDSSLGEVAGSHVPPGANWLTEQPPDLMATYNVAGASRPKDIDNVGPKISKEAKKKELHVFFVNLFKKHSVPLGTTGMAEARLPWKKMTNILAEQGLELAGWPDRVPKPRSDGKADKGISGFNTEHIGALYEAMKAGQIDFKPLAGGSQTHDDSRVRQRDDEMEDEVEIRPSKKAKLAGTRKLPKAFVAGKSVMKF